MPAYQIAARPMQPRRIPIRDKRYLEFLRKQPCIVPLCRQTDIEAMHTGADGACKGRKASDLDAVPCCSWHHRTGPRPQSHHSSAEWVWEGFHGISLAEERSKLQAKFREGA